MKKKSEQTYIEDLIRNTKDSIHFFSNASKTLRERSVCAAFLRCIGIEFILGEVVSNNDDPPDVVFRTARFEVMELYDKRRKRLDEYWQRLENLEKASSIQQTLVTICQHEPVSYTELLNEIISALNEKSSKYGKRLCSSLDALVYVGLTNRFLEISSSLPMNKELPSQGWRSVSFVFPPYSQVVFCGRNTPQFLTLYTGQTRMEWKKSDGLFDLELTGCMTPGYTRTRGKISRAPVV